MAYKSVQCTGTVSSISDAFSELTSLGEEAREIVDNAPEGLNQTDRIQTFEATADALENLTEPDVPACIADLPVTYFESVPTRKRQGTSRATRCSNAIGIISAVRDVADEWVNEHVGEDGEPKEGFEDDVEAVIQFVSECEEMESEAEGCEFPGMFG